jgi:hypothetical protein
MTAEKKQLIALLAVLAIAGSIVSVWRTTHRAGRPNLELFRAVGKGVAEQAAVIAGSQKEVVLIGWDPHGTSFPGADEEQNAFVKAARTLGLTIVATKNLIPTGSDALGIPGEQFLELSRSFPAAVIVSFVGPPLLNSESMRQLPASRPKCLVVTTEVDGRLRNLFRQRIVQLAILPGRRSASADKSAAQSYLVLTPEAVADFPSD